MDVYTKFDISPKLTPFRLLCLHRKTEIFLAMFTLIENLLGSELYICRDSVFAMVETDIRGRQHKKRIREMEEKALWEAQSLWLLIACETMQINFNIPRIEWSLDGRSYDRPTEISWQVVMVRTLRAPRLFRANNFKYLAFHKSEIRFLVRLWQRGRSCPSFC